MTDHTQPITQWVGQRPQKIFRTRRTNLTPVSNRDESQTQSEGCSPINITLLSKGVVNGNQNLQLKLENVSSPARLSESEDSGAGENRTKEKCVHVDERVASADQAIGPSAFPVKNNKSVGTEEISDSARRQGRSGRVSPFSRSSVSPTRENLDIVAPNKPLRNARSGSEKNGSKSGRPLKKLSDCKGFSRLSHAAKGSYPDCDGESAYDHEEPLAAANLASNNSCPTVYWKIFESLFASVGPDGKSFLSKQRFCTLEFDGASKGNPGQAGAGAILRSDDGSLIA